MSKEMASPYTYLIISTIFIYMIVSMPNSMNGDFSDYNILNLLVLFHPPP